MKFLLPTLLLFFSLNANSQEQQLIQVHCDRSESIINSLRKEHNQEILLWGIGPVGSTGLMSLWINSDNNWTILVSQPDGKTCIIGGGRDLTVRPAEKDKPKQNIPKSIL